MLIAFLTQHLGQTFWTIIAKPKCSFKNWVEILFNLSSTLTFYCKF